MKTNLSDTIPLLSAENLVFVTLGGLSVGATLDSRYGVISRISDTEFKITINEDLSLHDEDTDDKDPDRDLKGVFG